MVWQQSYRFRHFLEEGRTHPSLESLKINEQCFIRKEHKCGKIFGASKSCFIACPRDTELEPILALMSEKLTKAGIEPIIAVKERAYGQDIFCTKICGKIIEAKFCIVILDDSIVDDKNIPNPNVYYEYGAMTALKKHIVPLQKDNLELAFNIQSYDTIKYNSGNISSELDRAIKDAIKITESKDGIKKESFISDKKTLRNFEMAGFELKDEDWFLSEVIDDTQFKGFGHYEKGFYAYLGKVDGEEELQDYAEDLDVILYRTEKKARGLERALEKHKKEQKHIKKERKELTNKPSRYRVISPYRIRDVEEKITDIQTKLSYMSKIFIGFIINPQVDTTDFIKKIKSLIRKYRRYKLAYSVNNEIAFGDIHVALSFSSA